MYFKSFTNPETRGSVFTSELRVKWVDDGEDSLYQVDQDSIEYQVELQVSINRGHVFS